MEEGQVFNILKMEKEEQQPRTVLAIVSLPLDLNLTPNRDRALIIAVFILEDDFNV
jgi:hypothetical protein